MKKIFQIGLLLAIVGSGVGFMIYHKPHQNMLSTKADFQMTASELYSYFETDESAANKRYLDKVIEINGTVQTISKAKDGTRSITLDAGGVLGGVICKLDNLSQHKRSEFETGEMIYLKGICTGLLMDVVLIRCIEL